jgi:hypothetical protein
MSGLFGKPKMPEVKPVEMPKVKVERMPVANDPNADQAASRFREAAAARKGRRSTIMTDALKEMTGSSGQRLGS